MRYDIRSEDEMDDVLALPEVGDQDRIVLVDAAGKEVRRWFVIQDRVYGPKRASVDPPVIPACVAGRLR